MATEKTCKAYLIKENGHEKVRKTHAVVKKHLPRIAQHFYSSNPNRKQALHQLSEIKTLAGEVELLAPACDHGDLRQTTRNILGTTEAARYKLRVTTAFPTSMMEAGPLFTSSNCLVKPASSMPVTTRHNLKRLPDY